MRERRWDLVGPLCVAAAACRVSLADMRVVHGGGRWVFGWLTRTLCQVVFFSSLGVVIGDRQVTHFVFLGSALMLAVMDAVLAVNAISWDVGLGMLEVQVRAPQPLWATAVGRGIAWPFSGAATSTIGLLGIGPLVGVAWGLADIPAVVVLVLVTAAGSYGLALTLGALALRVPRLRNVVSNLGYLAVTILSGVFVSTDSWPAGVRLMAQTLPSTHALTALREIAADEGTAALWPHLPLAALAGALWSVAAGVAFGAVARALRRDGMSEAFA